MADPIQLVVTVVPPDHPQNPRPGQEFIHVQSSGLSLNQVRSYLTKATDTILVQLVTNTVRKELESKKPDEPLIHIPGMVPPLHLR